MLDAAGKVEPGVLIGNLWSMGSYRECVSIQANVMLNMSKMDFTGKYCHLSIKAQGASLTSVSVLIDFQFQIQLRVNTSHYFAILRCTFVFLPFLSVASGLQLGHLRAERVHRVRRAAGARQRCLTFLPNLTE